VSKNSTVKNQAGVYPGFLTLPENGCIGNNPQTGDVVESFIKIRLYVI